MAHMTASAEQSSSSLNYNTSTNNNHYNSNNNANNNNVKRKQLNEKAFDNDNSLIMKMSVEQWSYNDVAKWLTSIGFEHYANWIAFEHKIDGATLLTLTERDLREKPVEMQCLGDIKHLSTAISSLRNESFIHCSNSKSNLSTCSSSCHLSSHVHLPYANDINENSNASTLCADHQDGFVPIMNVNHGMYTEPNETSGMNLSSRENASGETRLIQVLTREHLIRQVESADTKNKSLIKLAIAFCYCTFSLLTSAFVMVLVHDRVPDMKTYPPLPDIVLDNLPLIPWAFEVCELIGVVLSSIWFIILFFHKHRIVVMRRMFSLVGTVFLLRCVTMLITSLSVPGVHLECSAKSYGALSAKLSEAYHIWSKLGMSIQGVRTCGDYMFSGHTTAVTLLNHFITEYTPDSWHGLHTMTWVMNLFGIFFILAGHEHYSIDVFIAFYISSRMFLYYHTFAYNHFNSTSSDQRIRIWFPLGWFFEAGGQGRVANEFEFPFSFPIASIFDYCKRFVHSHKLLSCQSNDKSNNKKTSKLVSVDNTNEQQHSLNDDSNPFSVTDHPSRQLKKRKSVKK